MQGDLISRTEVLKFIEDIKCNRDVPKNYGTLLDIMRHIYEMPCAYDMEKVIDEMNKYPHGYLNVETIYDLTEIVRNGGKE